jgi:hypothetical protein
MPDSDQPKTPALPPASDELNTIRQFKEEPVRAGCFGCTVSGWGLLVALAAIALLVYLAGRFFSAA